MTANTRNVRTQVLELVKDADDPREQIYADLKGLIDKVHPTGADVMICVYERGAGKKQVTTKGGIIVPETASTLAEDAFQGNVGLIVKLGPNAASKAPTLGRKPDVGQWVAFRTTDAYAFILGKRSMRWLQADFIRSFLDEPTIIT